MCWVEGSPLESKLTSALRPGIFRQRCGGKSETECVSPQAFQKHLVAGEGSAHACQVLKLPFRVTSVTSSLKRVGVLLLLGVFFFFSPTAIPLSTFSEYLSSRQVRYEGRELAKAVSEHHISLES